MKADIGVIGLAVMGQNLVLNMNDHNFIVAVFNRTVSKVDEFLNGPARGTQVIGTHSIKELIEQLKRPRKILLMVKAGEPVDEFISLCLPYLEKGDIIIDGGNSLYVDTNRRCQMLKEKGVLYIGAGISGGEEGARHGPSIMPGGHIEAWPHVKNIFQSISAKVDGEPCCEWVGENGSGHYVKMVHNGIEYGDMQLISEAYSMLKNITQFNVQQLHDTFTDWNKGDLNSYLIEITAKIFEVKDVDGKPLIDKILDVAGQKGTGKWTVIDALEMGIPLTLISEAVFARCLSALKDERTVASKYLPGPNVEFNGNKEQFAKAVGDGLYVSKIISYAQGFMLLQQAAQNYGWKLDYGNIALMWRGGCIIRSQFLGKIKEAYKKTPDLRNLIINDFFCQQIQEKQAAWRMAVAKATECGIYIPCFSAALIFYDGYRTARLPSYLLQAQRDFFGAHTYERIDRPRGQFFHTNWTGTGGDVSSGSYNV